MSELCRLESESCTILIYFVPFSIGSASDVSLQLGDELEANHFSIVSSNQKFFVVANGQMIVDNVSIQKYTPRFPLQNNSVLEFGKYKFIFNVIDGEKQTQKDIMHLKYQLVRKTME